MIVLRDRKLFQGLREWAFYFLLLRRIPFYNTERDVSKSHRDAGLPGVKFSLNTFFRQLWGCLSVPRLNTFQEFFLASHKIGAVIWPNDWWSAATGNEFFDSHYTRTRVHGRDNFNMYSSCGHTCKKEAPSFIRTPTDWDVKKSKIINTTVCEGRLAITKPLNWKLCHHRCDIFWLCASYI